MLLSRDRNSIEEEKYFLGVCVWCVSGVRDAAAATVACTMSCHYYCHFYSVTTAASAIKLGRFRTSFHGPAVGDMGGERQGREKFMHIHTLINVYTNLLIFTAFVRLSITNLANMALGAP